MINKSKAKSGYTLLEMVIYISLLFIISVFVVNTILSFIPSYKELLILRDIDHSANGSLERITREIRLSSSIDMSNTVTNSSPGYITLIKKLNNVNVYTKFYLENGVVKMNVDGQYYGPITISNANVTDLTFYVLDNGFSKAVRVSMTIEAFRGDTNRTKIYYTTVVLRGR